MDSVFLLGEGDRAVFVQHMMQIPGFSHICVWSHLPLPSKCLVFLDGIYREQSGIERATSSAGISFARMLFNEYCGSRYYVDHGRVPGFAFRNRLPYLEMKLDGVGRLASTNEQMRFYQEAGIQTVVFLGCTLGEIELGILSREPHVNLEMAIKSRFSIFFSSQTVPNYDTQNSTSSSSLRLISLSTNSLQQLPPIPDITSSCNLGIPEQGPREAFIEEALMQENLRLKTLNQMRHIGLPRIETEHDAMTRAILSVLTSSSSSSSSSILSSSAIMLNGSARLGVSHEPSGFMRYDSGLASVVMAGDQKQNILKRAVLFYREVNERRGRGSGESEHTAKQLHHVISERRRREKLSESFRALRSLLPPGSKKDNASVLSMTTQTIHSLKTQVEQLKKRNQTLETHLSVNILEESGDDGVNVSIEHIPPSGSNSRFFDLRVSLRSRECSSSDLVIRVLRFLKHQRNIVSLVFVQSNTITVEPTPLHVLIVRLKIEGDEFEKSSFQEAVKRVVDDLPR